jgi:hypothetical protein
MAGSIHNIMHPATTAWSEIVACELMPDLDVASHDCLQRCEDDFEL